MMFASLRSRLWLTYALLIGAVLTVVGIGLFLALVRNNSIFRQATMTLRVTEAVTLLRMDNLPKASTTQLDNLTRQVATYRNVRQNTETQQYQPQPGCHLAGYQTARLALYPGAGG